VSLDLSLIPNCSEKFQLREYVTIAIRISPRFELLTLASQSNGETDVAGEASWLSSCGR
jgi:hypothetical protein